MAKINETIQLSRNEGLEINISRIVYDDDSKGGNPTFRPSWMNLNLSAADIRKHFPQTNAFTEDDLEAVLKKSLENTFHCSIKSFRWMWDKFRDFKTI